MSAEPQYLLNYQFFVIRTALQTQTQTQKKNKKTRNALNKFGTILYKIFILFALITISQSPIEPLDNYQNDGRCTSKQEKRLWPGGDRGQRPFLGPKKATSRADHHFSSS